MSVSSIGKGEGGIVSYFDSNHDVRPGLGNWVKAK